MNDDINHDLWLEDIDPDERKDEAGIDPRDTYVPELDERDDYPVGDENYSQDTMDTYLGAEVNMPEGDGYQRAVVRKRKRDEEGRPMGQGNNNPILDTRMYEIEYPDGTLKEIQGNIIAQNILSQVDSEGHSYMLLDEISDHRSDGHAIQKED